MSKRKPILVSDVAKSSRKRRPPRGRAPAQAAAAPESVYAFVAGVGKGRGEKAVRDRLLGLRKTLCALQTVQVSRETVANLRRLAVQPRDRRLIERLAELSRSASRRLAEALREDALRWVTAR